MSFETSLFAAEWYPRQTYDNLESVLEQIGEEELIKENIEKELVGLALMTEPKKMLQIDEYTDPISAITEKVNQNLELYKDTIVQLYKLHRLESNWKESHTKIKDPSGKEVEVAKNPPENLEAYMWGDYVRTTKYPGWENETEEENN